MKICAGFIFILLIFEAFERSACEEEQTLSEFEDENSKNPVIYGCDDKILNDLIPTLELVKKTDDILKLKLDVIELKLEKFEPNQLKQHIQENLQRVMEKVEYYANEFLKFRTETENNLNIHLKALEAKILEIPNETLKLMDPTTAELQASTKQHSENLEQTIKARLDSGLQAVNITRDIAARLESSVNACLASSITANSLALSSLTEIANSRKLPKNCDEAMSRSDGIYKLHFPGMEPFKAYCMRDREYNSLPAWTVIQRRRNGEVDFYRNWTEYKNGFGDLENEFWLGLERIHVMTASAPHELLIELEDWAGEKRYAKYDRFVVGSAADGYELNSLGTYSGNAKDALSYSLYQKFTTSDVDHDEYSGNCATYYSGAWWYKKCHESHLNGLYNSTRSGGGVTWEAWHGEDYSLKFVQMAIRLKA